MTLRLGRRLALVVRFESSISPAERTPEPPIGADDGELARWRGLPPVDIEEARWRALALIHGGI